MIASDIIEEVKEAIGKCETAFALRTMTRAVQLLANKGLIDPLVGYFDFTVSDDYFVALPREVKTPLRININKQPSFSRSRLYEFHINAEGTADGDEPGLSWSDRGYSPIQDEKKLPGKLAYKTSISGDNGKTCTVLGYDEAGREQEEVLVGHNATPAEGAVEFHRITRVIREATNAEAFLWCNGQNVCAQYYANETLPDYRVIKLSKKASHVRVMFRRQVFAVTTIDDFIPMNSEMAVIQACKAVRYLGTDENDKALGALASAEMFLKEEQATREEHNAIAQNQEIQPAIDAAIFSRDGIIVADVYDVAADIFGGVGRRKLFDKITGAIELLSNKGQWDARLGVVDVYTADNAGAVTYDTPLGQTGRGHGYYVLPRHVETPVAFSYRCAQTIPRNRWFEFHLNGSGGMSDRSDCGAWDDCGEVCLLKPLPLDATAEPAARRVAPVYLVAVPDDSDDDGVEVRIYGFERDANDKDVEVWRDGKRGWLCPCVADSYDPGEGAPRWTSVERITKGESRGFIRLYSAAYTAAVTTPGDPIPDPLLVALGTYIESDGLTIGVNASGPGIVPTVGDRLVDFDSAAEAEITDNALGDGRYGPWVSSVGNLSHIVIDIEDTGGEVAWNTGGDAVQAQLYYEWASIGAVEAFEDENDWITVILSADPPVGLAVNDPIRFVGDFSGSPYTAKVAAIEGRYITLTEALPFEILGADVQLRSARTLPGPDVVVPGFWSTVDLFGFWYPDEVEPKYRMIRLPHAAPKRIRLLYRKRATKVTSLTEPIPLRSRLAIEQMLRAIKAGETDPNAAAGFEAQALRYLRDERINSGPSNTGIFQFDESTSPGVTGNVM